MPSKFDTEHWELYAPIGFRLKPHAAQYKTCRTCNGCGKKTGRQLLGFYDESDMCETCNGTGKERTYFIAGPEPELPIGLVEALAKTLREFVPLNYRTDTSEYYRA